MSKAISATVAGNGAAWPADTERVRVGTRVWVVERTSVTWTGIVSDLIWTDEQPRTRPGGKAIESGFLGQWNDDAYHLVGAGTVETVETERRVIDDYEAGFSFERPTRTVQWATGTVTVRMDADEQAR